MPARASKQKQEVRQAAAKGYVRTRHIKKHVLPERSHFTRHLEAEIQRLNQHTSNAVQRLEESVFAAFVEGSGDFHSTFGNDIAKCRTEVGGLLTFIDISSAALRAKARNYDKTRALASCTQSAKSEFDEVALDAVREEFNAPLLQRILLCWLAEAPFCTHFRYRLKRLEAKLQQMASDCPLSDLNSDRSSEMAVSDVRSDSERDLGSDLALSEMGDEADGEAALAGKAAAQTAGRQGGFHLTAAQLRDLADESDSEEAGCDEVELSDSESEDEAEELLAHARRGAEHGAHRGALGTAPEMMALEHISGAQLQAAVSANSAHANCARTCCGGGGGGGSVIGVQVGGGDFYSVIKQQLSQRRAEPDFGAQAAKAQREAAARREVEKKLQSARAVMRASVYPHSPLSPLHYLGAAQYAW